MYCFSDSSSCSSSDDEGSNHNDNDHIERNCEAESIVFHASERPVGRNHLANAAAAVAGVAGGGSGVVALPPLPLKDMVHEGVLPPREGQQQQDNHHSLLPTTATKPISARGTPRTVDASYQHHDLLAATKRKLVVRNANAAPSRCAEEQIVLQRFGEHMTRIPTPPVVKEPLHTTNSKEEKHQRNKLRIFGSMEHMARVIAGGTATCEKPSHTTVMCDAMQPQSARGNRSASPRQSISRDRPLPPPSSSPRAFSPRQDTTSNSALRQLSMPQEPNHKLAFADVMFLERQQLAQYLHTDGGFSPANTHHGGSGGPRLPASRGGAGGDNNFFLVSRASHRERVLASSMSARGTQLPPPPSAGGECPPSPRTPATARGATTTTSVVVAAGGGSTARRSSDAKNNVLSLTEPEELIVEDTSYVVRETRKFERGSLATAKRNWLSTKANLSADLSAARAESHTSDLLKMIFNARIALECDVASTLRQLADDQGTEKLIADAVSTGQRLAIRSANVNDFHHFLCNLLRDTTISFSETRVIFNAIDSNHSGVIDSVELSEGLRLLLLDESQLVLTYGKKVFTEIGRHKDTKLSFLEVQAIFFAALDFFEVEFDPTDVVNAAQIEPKSANSGAGDDGLTDGGDGTSLCAVPSVNYQQQAKLITRRDKSNSPKMTKRNTLAMATTSEEPHPQPPKRKDSAVFKSTAGAGPEPSAILESPVTVKPTLDELKKRMVRECAVVLRESWKYSQGGQIVVPLLRSLTLSVASLLHHAICHLPVHHFNLKRCGFWKETLAAEEAKYQVYLAQQNLDLPLSPPHRLLSFGGGLLSSSHQQRQAKLLQQQSAKANTSVPHTAQGGKGRHRLSGAGGDAELISELMEAQNTGAPPQQFRRSGSFSGGLSGSLGRRNSRDGHSSNHQVLSLNALQPISYEEYEEASGEAINIAALQAQLKDGSLRLTHAQRNLIVQQIEQGKAARQAAAAANLRGSERSTHHGRKSISGFANNNKSTVGHPSIKRKDAGPSPRGATRLVTEPTLTSAMEEDELRNEALMQEALQRKKSENRGSMRGGPSSHAVDLNEVIDPWHPRFQADRDKVQSIARQLGSAPEHSHNVYFSKQGHVFSKTPGGLVVPVTGNESSSSPHA